MSYTDYFEKAMDMANSVYDQGVKALSKTETERKLAEALSHANWGASTTLMGELAQATSDSAEYEVIMREVWAAVGSTGRNWRVAYKGLALLEFLLKNGHKRVIQEAKENRTKIRRMETFSYTSNGVEKGTGIREKAKAITELLDDDEVLKRERVEAAKLRAKFVGVGRDGQYNSSITGLSGGGGFDDFDDDRKASDASDSDDDKKKKKKKASKKKNSSDEEEAVDSDADRKAKAKSKSSKSKKKQGSDDDDFEADFSSSPVPAKKAVSSKKKAAEENDDDDFGFSDDETSKKKTTSSNQPLVKVGPLSSISVKIPGAGGGSSSSSSASSSTASAAATAKKKEEKEVNLLGDFDPFSAPAATTSAVAAPAPQKPQPGNILDLFGGSAPPPNPPLMGGAPAPPMGGGFMYPPMGGPGAQAFPPSPAAPLSQQQQPMMMGMAPQQAPMMMGMPPYQQQQQPMMMGMGMPQQQQPMMMGGMGMPQQQPMMMGAPMGMGMPQQQQPMMMGMAPSPSMGMGMGMPPMGMMPQQQQMKKPAEPQKKDAFSGLMDLYPAAAGTTGAKTPTGSLI